jgi:hypothetical protein
MVFSYIEKDISILSAKAKTLQKKQSLQELQEIVKINQLKDD